MTTGGSEMAKKLYSVLIAWCDSDTEQGEFGTIVRATNATEAERLARADMRQQYMDEYEPEEEDIEPASTFGGRALEIYEGAIWRASDIEKALRDLVDAHKGDACRVNSAISKARKVLASLDEIP
jgi:hypothetical protein